MHQVPGDLQIRELTVTAHQVPGDLHGTVSHQMREHSSRVFATPESAGAQTSRTVDSIVPMIRPGHLLYFDFMTLLTQNVCHSMVTSANRPGRVSTSRRVAVLPPPPARAGCLAATSSEALLHSAWGGCLAATTATELAVSPPPAPERQGRSIP